MMATSIVHRVRQDFTCVSFLHGLCFLGALAWLPNPSSAGKLESFSVIETDGGYETNIVALLDAPADHVYHVITDYRHIYRINPSIVESEVSTNLNTGAVRVRNRFEHCFAIFCFEIDLVEDVVEIGHRHLVATTVSELSSFKAGTAMWHVRPFADEQARVQYRAHVKPDFFLPPLIGSAIMKSMLRKEITSSLVRIECHARITALDDVREMPVQVAHRPGKTGTEQAGPPSRGC